jgi:hypothetical protein
MTVVEFGQAAKISRVRAWSNHRLLGSQFEAPSWDRWRAVLKAAYAEPMTPEEITLFHEVAERDPPTRPVRELWILAGRRAGKDSIASAIATSAALSDYRKQLRPGERASVLCLACNRDQARIVFRYIASGFRENPLMKILVDREVGEETIELKTGTEIIVGTNSFRAVRGKTISCAIFDECAFWKDDSSVNPDFEVYEAVLPGLVTLPNSILVGISTVYRRSGLAYERWKECYGKNDDDVLVVKGTSRQFNPTIPQSIIQKALARDPEKARAEYLSQWRDDLSTFISRELIEAAVDAGVVARPPIPGTPYRAFADPSGGAHDSFTCAIAHRQGDDLVVLDALYERRAPFNPSEAVEEIVTLLRSFGLNEVTGDRYSAQWVVEAFAKRGIIYRHSERDRSAIYIDCLSLFTSGRARILDNARLVSQFSALERRTFSTGRDRVDHPDNGADDLCNSAAGAMVAVGGEPTILEQYIRLGGMHGTEGFDAICPDWR